jgi:uncharacterized protein (TIGR03067 family)
MRMVVGSLVIGLGISLVGGQGLVLAQPPGEDAVKKELARLQGTWRVVEVEENGQKAPADKLRDAKLTVTVEGNKHTLKYGDKSVGPATITIDPTTKPKRYDMTDPEGPMKGQVLQGIYELEGDTWKFCQDKTGKGRPTEFAGKAGSGWVLVIMKKLKPESDKK